MGGLFSGAAARGCRGTAHTSIVAALASLLVLALFAGAAVAKPAPAVVITSAPDAVTQETSVSFAFATQPATDDASFECRFDGAVVDCSGGSYRASDLAEGGHTFTVRATTATGGDDEAPGAAVTYDFRVVRTAPATPVDEPAPVAPVAPAPVAPVAPAPAAVPAATPAARPRVPRLEIGTACMEVSAARANARLTLAGRNAIVRFHAPPAARYATFTLRRASGARHRGAIVAKLASAPVARATATHTARIALTRGQRRLVRSGAARLAIAYGTCRTQAGEWHWVAPARA